MKNLITISFLLIVTFTYSQKISVTKIIESYGELKLSHSLENQKMFFNSFPNTFETFKATFGYSNTGQAPLYDNHMEYIKAFFALDSLPLSTQMNKWIEISINGKWDADNVSFFQSYIIKKSLEYPQLLYDHLSIRNSENIESYFYFMFDSVHPHILTIPQEFDFIKITDSEFYSLIESAHSDVMNEKGHGH